VIAFARKGFKSDGKGMVAEKQVKPGGEMPREGLSARLELE
jgi:hypothetical protein